MGVKPLFPDKPKLEPCSFNECLNGHRWPPTMVVATCPGCGGNTLAFRLENCPFCNEPVKTTKFRSDLVPPGSGVAPRCTGAAVQGETMDLELERHAYAIAEVDHKSFEEKRDSPK